MLTQQSICACAYRYQSRMASASLASCTSSSADACGGGGGGGGGRLSLTCRIDVGEEDTFTMCRLKDGCLITGHRSDMKLWSPQLEQSTPVHVVSTLLPGDVSSITSSPTSQHHFAASVGDCVLYFDRRNLMKPTCRFQVNRDEIDEISIHQNGRLLSACDDSGDVKVIEIESAKVIRTLSGHHDNICSSAKFSRTEHAQIFSGGLDCNIIRWDFNRGHPVAKVATHESASQSGGSYLVNPPMVHCIDLVSRSEALVCGLGNGSVAAYSLRGGGLTLSLSAPLHSSAVGHVCTAPLDSRGSDVVVSGGNDSRVVVSELVATQSKVRESRRTKKGSKCKGRRKRVTESSDADVELSQLCRVDHGSKVNWLLVDTDSGARESFADGPTIFVADQSRFVSVYQLSGV